MKYKVGDKVRVRKDLEAGRNYDDCFFSTSMLKYCGCPAEVVLIDDDKVDVDFDTYRLDFKVEEWAKDWPWAWVDEMLEPAEESSGSSDEKPDVRFPTFEQTDNGMPHTHHYMNGLIETIDVIKMALTPEEFRGFLKGNVLKYELRAPYKHETPDEDYQKAKDYFNLLEEEEK